MQASTARTNDESTLAGVILATNTTPDAPIARPITRVALTRSPSHSAENIAAKSGVPELRITEHEAGKCSAAYENRKKGSAELAAPMTRYCLQNRRHCISKPTSLK